MSQSLDFNNPPSVEAVFELAAPNSGVWGAEELRSRLDTFVNEGVYPEYDIAFKKEFQFATENTQEPEVASTQIFWKHVEYRSSDKTQALRFGPDQMSFHRLKPYTSFEDLLPEVKTLWSGYQAVVQPKSVPQIGLRFINRIELPPETSGHDLSSYLSILPKNAFKEEGRTVTGILSQVQLLQESTGHQAAVSVSTAKTALEAPLVVLLNIQTRCTCDFAPDDEGIWNHFDSLREWKNELFLESLTEQCLTLFNK